VIVVPCTTARRGLSSHVELEPESSGLDELSYAKCEDVKSVPDRRLIARIGTANDEALFAIARALRSCSTSDAHSSRDREVDATRCANARKGESAARGRIRHRASMCLVELSEIHWSATPPCHDDAGGFGVGSQT
jgi:mRNA interferase MazF